MELLDGWHVNWNTFVFFYKMGFHLIKSDQNGSTFDVRLLEFLQIQLQQRRTILNDFSVHTVVCANMCYLNAV